jgi:hypothetical protein
MQTSIPNSSDVSCDEVSSFFYLKLFVLFQTGIF